MPHQRHKRWRQRHLALRPRSTGAAAPAGPRRPPTSLAKRCCHCRRRPVSPLLSTQLCHAAACLPGRGGAAGAGAAAGCAAYLADRRRRHAAGLAAALPDAHSHRQHHNGYGPWAHPIDRRAGPGTDGSCIPGGAPLSATSHGLAHCGRQLRPTWSAARGFPSQQRTWQQRRLCRAATPRGGRGRVRRGRRAGRPRAEEPYCGHDKPAPGCRVRRARGGPPACDFPGPFRHGQANARR